MEKHNFLDAAREGYKEVLENIFNHNPLLLNTTDDRKECDCPYTRTGATALYYSARFKNFECLKFLLNANAALEMADAAGQTALIKAAFMGDAKCFRLLLDSRANIEACDQSGGTCDEIGGTPLYFAAKNGHQECVRLLLDRNVNVNARGNDEAIEVADSGTIFGMLLKGGANITDIALVNKTNEYLKDILRFLDLPTAGKKANLIQRLLQYKAEQQNIQRKNVSEISELRESSEIKRQKTCQTKESEKFLNKINDCTTFKKESVERKVESEFFTMERDLKNMGFTDVYEALLKSGVDGYHLFKLLTDEFWAILQEENSHILRSRFVIVKTYISNKCSESCDSPFSPGNAQLVDTPA